MIAGRVTKAQFTLLHKVVSIREMNRVISLNNCVRMLNYKSRTAH
jgi:hypothetical protein